MNDINPNNTNNEAQNNENQGEGAPLTVVTQYLKDFSFENPGGSETVLNQQSAPTGTIRVDVKLKPATQTEVEVALFLSVEAKSGDKPIYVAEVDYAGLFRLGRVPQEAILPLLMIEAPRLLFPFARNLIATATQSGGFSPLYISPIDFAALFRQKRDELLRQQQANGEAMGQA